MEELELARDVPPSAVEESFDFDAAFSGSPAIEPQQKRWLLKILAGPNSGAQMNLEEGKSYLIGSDGSDCDIVLTDLSVSKHHLKLTLEAEGRLVLEDLNSRYGVLVNGERVDKQSTQTGSALVTVGSTTLMLVDRQAQKKSIIAPPIPIPERIASPEPQVVAALSADAIGETPPANAPSALGMFARLVEDSWTLWASTIACALVGLLSILTITLIRDRPFVGATPAWEDQMLSGLLEPYPFSYTYSPAEEKVSLQGHVSSLSARGDIIDKIRAQLPTIDIDTHGLIIDDVLCKEFNQVISRNWPEVTLVNPAPGSFALGGMLDQQEKLDKLDQYMAVQFPFYEKLKLDVLAVDSATDQVNRQLLEIASGELVGQFRGQELIIAGTFPPDKRDAVAAFVDAAKEMTGVKSVDNLSVERSSGDDDQNAIDLSSRYEVSGVTKRAKIDVAAMINGRIYQRGDQLDGMTVLSIRANVIILQRQGVRYRIAFSGL